jgi:hypothetical protein
MRAAAAAALATIVLAAPLASQTHLVLVSGLSGEPRYEQAFRAWSAVLMQAATERYGVPHANILYLADDMTGGPPRPMTRSTRDEIRRVLAELAGRAQPNAVIVIVLFGHGSAEGRTARFHLPGPDVTGAEFAEYLTPFQTQRVVVVNAASASGDWIGALSGGRRVVITATRSGGERLDTKFGQYFAEALSSGDADTDQDERVSVLEAFQYARHAVSRLYEGGNRLATEHALLDDNGDGKGTAEPSIMEGDGSIAARIFLEAGPRRADGDPRLAPLYAQRDSLEALVATLGTRKDAMEPAAYERELERLLLDLARVNRAIREQEGSEP